MASLQHNPHSVVDDHQVVWQSDLYCTIWHFVEVGQQFALVVHGCRKAMCEPNRLVVYRDHHHVVRVRMESRRQKDVD